MIASAGAGGGSFNHRFAMPGHAGNSVLSILRPVDLPPFTDDGLMVKARDARVTPKIFYTFSSREYWARAGSLTHTSEDGRADVPLAETSRLYLLTGAPHASGPPPPARPVRSSERAQLCRPAMGPARAARRSAGVDPFRHAAAVLAIPDGGRKQLVALDAVTFPRIAALPFAPYLPPVWRMDYGPDYPTARVITNEPPVLGGAYTVLVPQVDKDGNEVAGVRLSEIAVPLGTYTGWNLSVPQLADLRYLAGLRGSFEPFARTRAERDRAARSAPSIDERYSGREDYLARVARATRISCASASRWPLMCPRCFDERPRCGMPSSADCRSPSPLMGCATIWSDGRQLI